MTDTKSDEHGNHSGGRPLKFQTVDLLDRAISAYFDMCDPHTQRRVVDCGINEKGETIWRDREVMTEQKPYTMSGLGRAIGLSRQALVEYKARDGFGDSIRAAKQRCEEFWEGMLASPFANGAKFNLANNYRDKFEPWSDKQVIAGDPDAPLGNPLGPLTTEQLRRLAEAQDHASDEPNDGDPSTDPA